MRRHVIPHNIMNIDFKLFGFMNLKQFIYVAGGSVIAYVTFLLVREGALPVILGWPLIIMSVTLGISFGLVTLKGRSLDQWLISYVSAINAPTKRAWMKKKITPDVIPASIPVEQLKPIQIGIDSEVSVSEIIGALSIPVPQINSTSNIAGKVLVEDDIKTLVSPVQTLPGPNASPQVAQGDQDVVTYKDTRHIDYNFDQEAYSKDRHKAMIQTKPNPKVSTDTEVQTEIIPTAVNT